MEGLNGVIFVEACITFRSSCSTSRSRSPISTARWRNPRRTSAQAGFRLFRRIVFPLAMPGYLAGAALVFLKVFDDVGTPLVLNVTNMLAPQAYLRITSIGIDDPIGYVTASSW